MSAPLVLAIDAGGTAVKVALVDGNGRVREQGAADVRTDYLPDGRVERDPEAFWKATAAAIRALMQSADTADRIAAIGCTGFGNGIFLVDERGRATRPGIVSVDHRAQPIVDGLAASGQDKHFAAVSGQRAWGGQTIMQLAHLARYEPEVMRRTRWALSCKDFIRMRLSGEAWTDPTDASGGGLMDLERGGYGLSLFETLGMPEVTDKLPPLAENSGIGGKVSSAAAAESGLRVGTPIAGSMMDVASCVIGAGVTNDRSLVMIAGTWSINCIESRAVLKGEAPILNMLHRDRSCRLIAEGSPSSAANLGWYLDHALGSRVTFDQASELVANSPTIGRRCHFLPFIHGPAPRRGAFLDLGSGDDQGSMLRAIFEGVAFQHRVHAEDVLRHAAVDWPETIRLAGGAARSAQWTRIFADVMQKPVEIAEAEEVGAQGAAICAAVAGGLYPDIGAAAGAMTRIGYRREPDRRLAELYETRFNQFRGLDRGMLALFA